MFINISKTSSCVTSEEQGRWKERWIFKVQLQYANHLHTYITHEKGTVSPIFMDEETGPQRLKNIRQWKPTSRGRLSW